MAKSTCVCAVLAGTALLASCGATAARQAALMASARRTWLPSARPAAHFMAPSPALEPGPAPALEVSPAPARDPSIDLITQIEQRQALIRAQREWQKMLDELRARELETWKRTPEMVTQQSEPLLFEDLLRLNIQEDPRVSPDLRKLLLTTRSDLPLTINEHVLRYVNYFLGRGRNTLRESLRRAGSYRPMISRILAEESVPQELIYLVQAESGFRPQARSPKKATGMWQFVAARGREYGLNQTRHIDERLDPEKATRAAARHLADLYAQFGNWYLAMAAYNCGPGGVQRAVERTGYADYWELVRRGVLPRETSNYVPVILAMTLLGKNAEAFHFNDVVPESPIHYDTVQTGGRIGLGLIADATGASVARIRQLNPALLSAATPDGPYALRVPKDSAERFEQEIAAVPEPRRLSWRRHEVREQETVAQIAAQYKVKPAEIMAVNSFAAGGPQPGDRVTVPVLYRPEPARATAARTHVLHYRVRPGDSLGSIGHRYRVTVAQLQQWNQLAGAQVRTGRVLSVRVASSSPASSGASATVSPAKSAHPAKRRTASPSRAASPKAGHTTVAQATTPGAGAN